MPAQEQRGSAGGTDHSCSPTAPALSCSPGTAGLPVHKASPAGRGRRICSLEELVQEQRGLQPLLSVLLCRALLSLQNGKHVSLTEPQAVCVPTESSFLQRLTLLQQSRQRQHCLTQQRASQVHAIAPRDSRAAQTPCAADLLLVRSTNSSLSGWLLDQNSSQILIHYVPTQFYADKKPIQYAKISIRSTCTNKKALLQHAEMLMWALQPQEQVLFFCKRRELKLQSSNH